MKKLIRVLATTLSLILIYEAAAIPLAQAAALTPPPAMPRSIGQIVHMPVAPVSEKTIFHIQDIHTNTAAQINLYAIVSEFAKQAVSRGRKLLVFIEGSSGVLDSDLISSMPDKEAVREVGAGLLRKGILFGEEYAAITNAPGTIRLVGVENPELYRQNGRARDVSATPRAAVLATLQKMSQQLDLLDRHNFNPVLTRLERMRRLANQGNGSLINYVIALNEADSSEFQTSSEAKNLLSLAQQEGKFDAASLRAAHEALLARLAGRMTPGELEQWTRMSAAVKEGRLSPYTYYSSLLHRAGGNNPTLAAYVSYLKATETMDTDAVLASLSMVEDRIANKLIKHPVARQLYVHKRWLERQIAFFSLEMIPQEWARQEKTTLGDVQLTLANINAFIEEQKTALGYGFKTPTVPTAHIKLAYKGASAFYRAATLRDRAMSANIEAYLRSNNEERDIVFIAGGFHTPGLTKALNAKGYNVAVLRPQIETSVEISNKVNFYRAPGALVNAPVIKTAIETKRIPPSPEEGFGHSGHHLRTILLPLLVSLPFLMGAASPKATLTWTPMLIMATVVVTMYLAYQAGRVASSDGRGKAKMKTPLTEPVVTREIKPNPFEAAENFVAALPKNSVVSALSQNGRFAVSFSQHGTLQVIDLINRDVKTGYDLARKPVATAISNDGREVAFLEADGNVWSWRVGGGKQKERLSHAFSGSPLTSLAFDQNSNVYMAGDDLWQSYQRNGGREMLARFNMSVTAIQVGREHVISGHTDGSVRVAITGAQKMSIKKTNQPIMSVALNSDDTYAAVGQMGVVRILNVGTGEWAAEFPTAPGPVVSLSYGADGQSLYSLNFDGTILRHNVAAFNLRRGIVREISDPSRPNDILSLSVYLVVSAVSFLAGWIVNGFRKYRRGYKDGFVDGAIQTLASVDIVFGLDLDGEDEDLNSNSELSSSSEITPAQRSEAKLNNMLQEAVRVAGLSGLGDLADKDMRTEAINKYNAHVGGLEQVIQGRSLEEVTPTPARIPVSVSREEQARFLNAVARGERAWVLSAGGRATRLKLPHAFDQLGLAGLTPAILKRFAALGYTDESKEPKEEEFKDLIEQAADGVITSADDTSFIQRDILQLWTQLIEMTRNLPEARLNGAEILAGVTIVVTTNPGNVEALGNQLAGLHFPGKIYVLEQPEVGGVTIPDANGAYAWNADNEWPEGHGVPFIAMAKSETGNYRVAQNGSLVDVGATLRDQMLKDGVKYFFFGQSNDMHFLRDMAAVERWQTALGEIDQTGAEMVMEMTENKIKQKGGGTFKKENSDKVVMRDTLAMKTPTLDAYAIPASISRMTYVIDINALGKLDWDSIPAYLNERNTGVLTLEVYSGDASSVLESRTMQEDNLEINTFKQRSRTEVALNAIDKQNANPVFGDLVKKISEKRGDKPRGWSSTTLFSVDPVSLGLLIATLPVVLPLALSVVAIAFVTKWSFRALFSSESASPRATIDTDTFAGRSMVDAAATPELNRETWVSGAARIVRNGRLTQAPAVQKVIVNADEFSTLSNDNSIAQIALALGGQLNILYGNPDSFVNQVELVVYGRNSENVATVRSVASRHLRIKVTPLTGDKLNSVDTNDATQILAAAGVAGNLADQTIYVLTSESRENAGRVVYQKINDRVLDMALALFSYTRFSGPSNVFEAFSNFFKLPTLSESMAIQVLIALQA